jgi:hypothetical protein
MTLADTRSDTPLLGRRGRTTAIALGCVAIALAIAVVSVAAPPKDNDDLYESAWDFVRDAGFLLYLGLSIAAVEIARRRAVAPTAASRCIQVGYLLIAVGVAIGLVIQDDPDWFFALAGPGILASIVGFVWWAIRGVRDQVLPLWAGVLLGVGGLTAILGAQAGTTVLVGSAWIYLGSRRADGHPGS